MTWQQTAINTERESKRSRWYGRPGRWRWYARGKESVKSNRWNGCEVADGPIVRKSRQLVKTEQYKLRCKNHKLHEQSPFAVKDEAVLPSQQHQENGCERAQVLAGTTSRQGFLTLSYNPCPKSQGLCLCSFRVLGKQQIRVLAKRLGSVNLPAHCVTKSVVSKGSFFHLKVSQTWHFVGIPVKAVPHCKKTKQQQQQKNHKNLRLEAFKCWLHFLHVPTNSSQ